MSFFFTQYPLHNFNLILAAGREYQIIISSNFLFRSISPKSLLQNIVEDFARYNSSLSLLVFLLGSWLVLKFLGDGLLFSRSSSL